MSAVLDIEKRQEEVRALLFDDKVSQALHRLMDFVRDFSDDRAHINEVTVLSANFRRVETAERQKRLSFKEAQNERTDLLYQALGLIDAIVESLSLEVSDNG